MPPSSAGEGVAPCLIVLVTPSNPNPPLSLCRMRCGLRSNDAKPSKPAPCATRMGTATASYATTKTTGRLLCVGVNSSPKHSKTSERTTHERHREESPGTLLSRLRMPGKRSLRLGWVRCGHQRGGPVSRENRRLALQSTAELDRGLEILDRELRLGRFQSARETVAQLRAVVRVADATLVDYLRNTPVEGVGRA